MTSRSSGKERDTETGLDYFGARFYGSNMGRWMSPDWSAQPTPIPYANLGHPQSLNLYSYARNAPVRWPDLDGHTVTLGTNSDKGKDLLLANVTKKESALFTTQFNSKTSKLELRLNKEAANNFEGKHSKAYERLVTAIENKDKTIDINVSKTFVDKDGKTHNVQAEYGGGVTLPSDNRPGDSTVVVSPDGNPTLVYGPGGNEVPDPVSMIMAHEALGHGVQNMLGKKSDEKTVIPIENDFREEQRMPLRRIP